MKEKLFAMLDERIAGQTHMVADGRCETIETYRYACGVIQGLKMVKSDIEDLISSSETTKEGFE